MLIRGNHIHQVAGLERAEMSREDFRDNGILSFAIHQGKEAESQKNCRS
jgi:hypothetical protein